MKRAVVLFAACSSGSADPDPEPPPPPRPDAAVVVPEPQPPLDPAGMHVDDDGPKKPPVTGTKRPSHPIDVTLRSTPSKARVLVDGMFVGVTPTYWSGNADGLPHVFAFVYEPPTRNAQRYAVAQYKFVPVTSGVIHARLEPIASDDKEPAAAPDAVVPAPTPDAGVPRAVPPPPPPPPPAAPAPGSSVPGPQP